MTRGPTASPPGASPSGAPPSGASPSGASLSGASPPGVLPPSSPGARRATRPPRRPSAAALRAKRRGLMRLAVLVLGLLSVAVLGYLLLGSSALGVRSVAVEGTSVLSPDEVRRAAAMPPGQPMLRLDVGAVADRVGRLAPVLAVRVERSWPSTVVVHVTERAPVAFEPTAGGARLVDGTGLFFATVATPPAGLPELRALDGSPAQAA
ncbi:MAG TPA: FtsQ-type POTRA domain-containing protein, partial [Micromonosporaceae bacterium]|nr:FtsQ-type POTRA domain-containing protein [Micromonosporaceae bacterium]